MHLSRKSILSLLALAATALLFTGCQTMNGAGKDIESAGEAIQDAAT